MLAIADASAQRDVLGGIRNRIPQGGGGGGNDSLRRRDKFEDSLTISYRFLDSTQQRKLDTSVTDYYQRFPVPYTFHYLGNPGAPAYSLLFQPIEKAGFDPGFHTLDPYKFTPEKARFFNTTKPYTELGFTMATGGQLIMDLLHTQNLKPNWNMSFEYRLINSPGYFKNQKTVHNNYLVNSWYQSPNRRYNNFVSILGNKLIAGEYGGIQNDLDYMNDQAFDDRYRIPTKLAPNARAVPDLFSTNIQTGTRHSEFQALMRQQFDLGRKDSIVTDSTVIPLFYPRLRFEHTLRIGEYKYSYRDNDADSAAYRDFFGVTLDKASDSFQNRDKWNEFRNEFSVYQFPDQKNLAQFIRVGAFLQQVKGTVRSSVSFTNLALFGEYRNRTRNRKWDMNAFGQLFLSGYNGGDYEGRISLQRTISERIGSLQAGFVNSSRTPAYVFNERSNFYMSAPTSLQKENTSHVFGTLQVPRWKMELGADYYLVTNFLFFSGLYNPEQSGLLNMLRLRGKRSFRLGGRWVWHAELYLQQKAGNAGIDLPLFFTRNRIQYEGSFGFPNLNVATGIEWRYHTPFHGPQYSPLIGQFSYQDSLMLKNRPDVHAFFHFRIRSFKAFARAENLNSFRFRNSIGFKQQNAAAPGYFYPGLVLRLGIFWSFVN